MDKPFFDTFHFENHIQVCTKALGEAVKHGACYVGVDFSDGKETCVTVYRYNDIFYVTDVKVNDRKSLTPGLPNVPDTVTQQE